MKTKLFLLLNLLVLSLPVTTSAASIGVIRSNSTCFKIFDPEDGSLLGTEMLDSTLQQIDNLDYNIVDILNSVGIEWLTFDDGDIKIYDQVANLVDTFSVYSETATYDQAIAVGNVTNDYLGKEVAICKKSATISRLKLYAYSEDSGATKLLSFKPFGEGSRDRGCNGLAIGDIDGDNANEIIAFRHHSKLGNSKVKIFDDIGNVKSSFDLPFSITDMGKLHLGDINGDGADDIIFQERDRFVYAFDGEGNQIYKFNSNLYNGKDIQKIDVADIDDDGTQEVVIQEVGRKVPILILTTAGEVDKSYTLYPNASKDRNRFMFLGDFTMNL